MHDLPVTASGRPELQAAGLERVGQLDQQRVGHVFPNGLVTVSWLRRIADRSDAGAFVRPASTPDLLKSARFSLRVRTFP